MISQFKKIAYEKLDTHQPNETFENYQNEQGQVAEKSGQKSGFRRFFALLYIGVLIIIALVGFKTGERYSCRAVDSSPIYYSPIAKVLPLQPKIFVKDDPFHPQPESIYTGNPGPEVERAWKDLMRNYNMRIPLSTLERLNRTSIAISDGSGDHWGSLEVFNHLCVFLGFLRHVATNPLICGHCLKLIREALAPPGYYDPAVVRLTDHLPGHVYPQHIEHCVERIRGYLMCRPDLTVFTHDWLPGRDEEPMPNHAVKHACINWDNLEAWVGERRFGLGEGLVRRENGSVWPANSDEM